MAHADNQIIEIIPSLLAGDATFNHENIPFCTLCIEVDERRIRFCIVRDENMECVWIEDYGFDKVLNKQEVFERLKRIFKGHLLWSSNSWKNVKISINSHIFSLVPSVIFDEKEVKNYLNFATGTILPQDETILYHEIPIVHAVNIFSMPSLWYEWIINHFSASHLTFYHITTPLIIGALVSHAENDEIRIVSLYFEADYFTIMVTENNKLTLCNRFKFYSTSELVYLILFTLEQIEIIPEKVKVICYGEVYSDSENIVELKNFFPYVEIGKGPTTLKYHKHCGDIPGHRYFGLFNTCLVSS